MSLYAGDLEMKKAFGRHQVPVRSKKIATSSLGEGHSKGLALFEVKILTVGQMIILA
jgi:hypothetical protein